jgi:hypothetical protein
VSQVEDLSECLLHSLVKVQGDHMQEFQVVVGQQEYQVDAQILQLAFQVVDQRESCLDESCLALEVEVQREWHLAEHPDTQASLLASWVHSPDW